ncbi:MAG: RsmB/NOP family class I SAM-dependent RNA methyltransferase [Rhodobiaceae bacterium]|nr:RsmB/NOP family class I SAM-dependent RNA methyltransferase [Rhodobiaceae bacterium]
MTPAARLSAAIEILDQIAKGKMADRVLAAWAKANRYAGSKDRAAIQERVFDVLRNRALYGFALDSIEPRALVQASVLVKDRLPSSEVAGLFDGARFAPSPLSEQEESALSQASARLSETPDHVRLNVPEWLLPELRNVFGENLEVELAALNTRAPVDLRVNSLKTTRAEAQAGLATENIETDACEQSPWALRSQSKARVTHTKTFNEGLVEIQDLGSQLTCIVSGVKAGERVVDLCAGAGGKALALSAMLSGDGSVIACDTDPRRLGRLKPRADRAGAGTIETRRLRPFDPNVADPDLEDLEGLVDCVFVDAPCSGTGAWRRQPEARWQLTPEKLDAYRAAQIEVLIRGARLVRPGGRLIYVTCSILPSENDNQIDAFLKEITMFQERDWRSNWPDGVPMPSAPEGPRLRLTPNSTGTDGFFAVILERVE